MDNIVSLLEIMKKKEDILVILRERGFKIERKVQDKDAEILTFVSKSPQS